MGMNDKTISATLTGSYAKMAMSDNAITVNFFGFDGTSVKNFLDLPFEGADGSTSGAGLLDQGQGATPYIGVPADAKWEIDTSVKYAGVSSLKIYGNAGSFGDIAYNVNNVEDDWVFQEYFYYDSIPLDTYHDLAYLANLSVSPYTYVEIGYERYEALEGIYIYISANPGGVFVLQEEIAMVLAAATWHKLRITKVGRLISFYINDVLIKAFSIPVAYSDITGLDWFYCSNYTGDPTKSLWIDNVKWTS